MFETGKTWNYRVTNDVNHVYYFDLEVTGTSIIDNKTYYDVVASHNGLCETFLREDLVEMKIYGIWEGDEYLHYDFNLEVGDSIWLLGDIYEITAIAYGSFYGMDNLKYYVLNDDFKLIEGIGLENYGIADTFEYGCLIQPIFETLQLIGINEQLSTNTNQIYPIAMYPNPTANTLNFKSNQPIEKVTVLNMVGKMVTQIEGHITQLDISNFSKGIFFVKVETLKGSTIQKILKI